MVKCGALILWASHSSSCAFVSSPEKSYSE